MKALPQRVIELMLEVLRGEIRQDFRADSCIASTRVTIKVLEHFHIDAFPITCRVRVYNKAFIDALHNGALPHKVSNKELEEFCKATGAHSVGIGCLNEGEKLIGPGHLVTFVPRLNLLIDASIDQADRPEKNIKLPSVFVANVNKAFLSGKEPLEYDILAGSKHSTTVIYERTFLPSKTYKMSSDWTRTDRTKRATREVINYIEAHV
jgi:hypothetical protein